MTLRSPKRRAAEEAAGLTTTDSPSPTFETTTDPGDGAPQQITAPAATPSGAETGTPERPSSSNETSTDKPTKKGRTTNRAGEPRGSGAWHGKATKARKPKRVADPDVPVLTGRNTLTSKQIREICKIKPKERPIGRARFAHKLGDIKDRGTINTSRIKKFHQIAKNSSAIQAVSQATAHTTGSHGTMTFEAFFVLGALNAVQKGHQGSLTQIGTGLLALTPDQRDMIGLDDHPHAPWSTTNTEDRIGRFFAKATACLRDGIVVPRSIACGFGTTFPVNVDGKIDYQELDDRYRAPSNDYTWAVPKRFQDRNGHCIEPVSLVHDDWFLQVITTLGIDKRLVTSGAVALDGTMLNTAATLHGGSRTVYDGDSAYIPQKISEPEGGFARILAVGEDGRNIWTLDADARGGYRTSTDWSGGSPMVGYELHLAVTVKPGEFRGDPGEAYFGREVPQFYITAVLVPASTRRAEAVTNAVIATRDEMRTTEIMTDPAYSLAKPENWFVKLREHRIRVLFQPASYQRGINNDVSEPDLYRKMEHTILWANTPQAIAGTPEHNRFSFPMPGYGATFDEAEPMRTLYNQRAHWRWRLDHISDNGDHYFTCPFCAGSLVSSNLNVRSGKPANKTALSVGHVQGTEDGFCCNGPLKLSNTALGPWQHVPVGTTAHSNLFLGRRQSIESGNSRVKGGHTNMQHKWTRVLGIVKRRILTAFSLFAMNFKTAENWLEAHPDALDLPHQPMKSTRTIEREQKERKAAAAAKREAARLRKRQPSPGKPGSHTRQTNNRNSTQIDEAY